MLKKVLGKGDVIGTYTIEDRRANDFGIFLCQIFNRKQRNSFIYVFYTIFRSQLYLCIPDS